MHIPVPTLETDLNLNLFKTTGLTPHILVNRKDSWTVRAMIGRATNGRVDSSLYDRKGRTYQDEDEEKKDMKSELNKFMSRLSSIRPKSMMDDEMDDDEDLDLTNVHKEK